MHGAYVQASHRHIQDNRIDDDGYWQILDKPDQFLSLMYNVPDELNGTKLHIKPYFYQAKNHKNILVIFIKVLPIRIKRLVLYTCISPCSFNYDRMERRPTDL